MKWRGRSWEDLRPRVITSAVLIVIGVVVVWTGGTLFAATAAVVAGILVWELAAMLAPDRRAEAWQLALLSAGVIVLLQIVPPLFILPLLVAPALVGVGLIRRHTVILAAFTVAILVFAHGLVWARSAHGLLWLLWLVVTVVVTDVAGYFGGRSIGGPKFWPAVSPKKTWAGILCGWMAAALAALVFVRVTGSGYALIWVSVLVSFASQLGDIAESAVKRKVGVKDSSTLLPGHGGLFDRFDGLLGGTLFMLLAAQLVDLPDLIY